MFYLGDLLHTVARPKLLGQYQPVPVLLVQCNERRVAVHVDAMAGTREIVVKGLGPQFAGVQGLSGATILGDGRVVLIIWSWTIRSRCAKSPAACWSATA